ncbi:MAG: bifunctional [glutamate--ammonia ligase]-adenylyl-L-tyrosine phosphorylase/[glutamate--ammonia-ligase] adenylyltransferase, partial [Proteobacteria bacterium]|nr:bifunctional [glutamate--ammonia ligase]-adenylyl-L-tyrosine phosphorylase/[glutamate--ammonia-ligase] adenylyltransferase [Pseudomonadota bacterium]
PYPLASDASRDAYNEAAAFLSDQLDKASIPHLATAMVTAPYLDQLFRHNMPLVESVLAGKTDTVLDTAHSDFTAAMTAAKSAKSANSAKSDAEVMAAIRTLRKTVNLAVAITDITDTHSVADHLRWLSKAAETASHQLAEYLVATSTLKETAGKWCILAMGKLGAEELNFSSDIDLLVLYEAKSVSQNNKNGTGDEEAASRHFIALTRQFVKLMSNPTEDGIGWRVDLRLRPNPSVTPVAISVMSAIHYYESIARTWERAAFIRARPIAGDLALGEAFLADIAPFIWRRYLDYAVIDDMRMMWQREPKPPGLLGYHVKKGQGGIRAIEFFVHIQQLIAGGREKDLRRRGTAEALASLAKKKWITDEESTALTEYYYALRRLEHRIQMGADAHAHQLPRQAEDMLALAHFCGYGTAEEFTKVIEAVTIGVEKNSASVGIRLGVDKAETAAHASASASDIAGAGDDGTIAPDPPKIALGLLLDQDYSESSDDSDALHRSLADMGFDNVASILPICRKWLAGEVAATQSPRAREILTRILPRILQQLSRAEQPTQAFHAFAGLVESLPFGVQLFSLLESNPTIAKIMAAILVASPRLTDELSAHPQLADELLYDEFWQAFDAGHDADTNTDVTDVTNVTNASNTNDSTALSTTLSVSLTEAMAAAPSFEEALDTLRRILRRWRFRVSVHLVSGRIDCATAGRHLTAIAEAALRSALPIAHKRVIDRHGSIKNASMLVVALGRLGAREMTAASDLDLVFIHDAPDEAESDGTKPLHAAPYFTRIAQQLINALTAATSEGSAYAVDMRLRPSGKSGPVTLTLASFLHYQKESAWVWEHMALIRARVITGIDHKRLEAEFEAGLGEVLRQPHQADQVLPAVADMRRRITSHKPPKSHRDVRLIAGGLLDFDFFAQAMQLLHPIDDSASRKNHAGRYASGVDAVKAFMARGIIDEKNGTALIAAGRVLMDIDQLMRLTMLDPHSQTPATPLPQPLVERFDIATIADLDRLVAQHAETITRITTTHKPS